MHNGEKTSFVFLNEDISTMFYIIKLNRRKLYDQNYLCTEREVGSEPWSALPGYLNSSLTVWIKLVERHDVLQGRLHKLLLTSWHRCSQVRQLGSGSVGLQSVLLDNFARLGINKRILQVINWKTLSLFLRLIALALYLGHSVNQIVVKCCEIGVLRGWLVI